MARDEGQSFEDAVQSLLAKHAPKNDKPTDEEIRRMYRAAEVEAWDLGYRGKDDAHFKAWAQVAGAIDDLYRQWCNPAWWERNALGREHPAAA